MRTVAAVLRNEIALSRIIDGLLDERRPAVVHQFTRSPIRRRTDAGDTAKRVRFNERRDVLVETQHRFGGALVAPPSLTGSGERCHVEQQAAQLEVHVPHRQRDMQYSSTYG